MTVMSENRAQVHRSRPALSVEVARPVPVEGPDGVDLLAQRIRSGRALLEVVAYPWGVEFGICEVVESR